MFNRKLKERVAALERDWSPVINAAIGGIEETRRILQIEGRAEREDMARRMHDAEQLLLDVVDKIEELDIRTEQGPIGRTITRERLARQAAGGNGG